MKDSREQGLLRILLHAYPDRVTVRRTGDPSRGVMVGGRGIVLEPSSVVRKSPLFLSIDPRDPEAGGGTESRVTLASTVEEDWLEKTFPDLIERTISHRFDPEKGKVITSRQIRFAGLTIRDDAVGTQSDREGAAEVLSSHFLAHPGEFLALDNRIKPWLIRLAFLRRHMPDLQLPDLKEAALHPVIRQVCEGCISVDQVRRRGLLHTLEYQLNYNQRKALEKHAPETLTVPSGSHIRVQYPENEADSPTMAVRLQEIFGWRETPRVAAGRAPILLHLLGPNIRPVQITADLQSFWANTYPEVRRDLRVRYPRHPWPEDPLSAKPVSVGGRRRR